MMLLLVSTALEYTWTSALETLGLRCTSIPSRGSSNTPIVASNSWYRNQDRLRQLLVTILGKTYLLHDTGSLCGVEEINKRGTFYNLIDASKNVLYLCNVVGCEATTLSDPESNPSRKRDRRPLIVGAERFLAQIATPGLCYACQLSRIMRESHAYWSKTSISCIRPNFSRLAHKWTIFEKNVNLIHLEKWIFHINHA